MSALSFTDGTCACFTGGTCACFTDWRDSSVMFYWWDSCMSAFAGGICERFTDGACACFTGGTCHVLLVGLVHACFCWWDLFTEALYAWVSPCKQECMFIFHYTLCEKVYLLMC